MKGGSFMMWKKVISMLLVAAMLAMPIGCGKDGNKDKDTTSGVETTDTGDDSAETVLRQKHRYQRRTKKPKNQIKTRIPRTKQISRTMIMNRHRLRKKNMKVCLLRI